MTVVVWGVIFVAMLVIEAISVQLTSIWFALGAVAALIAAAIKPDAYGIQIALFLVVSVIALAAARPLIKKRMETKFQPTNADKCLGKEGIVTQTIDPVAGTGLVKLDGSVWTARSDDDGVIEEGCRVTAESISGVKLIVKKV